MNIEEGKNNNQPKRRFYFNSQWEWGGRIYHIYDRDSGTIYGVRNSREEAIETCKKLNIEAGYTYE